MKLFAAFVALASAQEYNYESQNYEYSDSYDASTTTTGKYRIQSIIQPISQSPTMSLQPLQISPLTLPAETTTITTTTQRQPVSLAGDATPTRSSFARAAVPSRLASQTKAPASSRSESETVTLCRSELAAKLRTLARWTWARTSSSRTRTTLSADLSQDTLTLVYLSVQKR